MGYENCTGRPEEYTEERIIAEGKALLEWIQKEGNIFVKQFASQQGYHSSRLSEFAQKNVTFSQLYSRAKEVQELKLLSGGLLGAHKEQMSKFVLVNHHNYKDKSEISATVDGKLSISTVDYSKAD